jgi:hypothetical protein
MRWAAEQLLARPRPLPSWRRAVGGRWPGAILTRLRARRRGATTPEPPER